MAARVSLRGGGLVGGAMLVALTVLGACSSDEPSSGSGGPGSSSGAGASGSSGAGGSSGASGSSGGSGDPNAVCGSGPLTQWEKMMLDKHNEWRASVAPAADKMLRVHWDRAIAANAAKWIASCDPDWPHSPEAARKNIGGYDVLGENLSYCTPTSCAKLPGVTDGSGLGDGDGWWEERKDYDWATDKSKGLTSHYTQLASSNVYAIGCATKKCGAPGPFGWGGDWWWTICQYGPRGQAYFVGTKPYQAGAGGLVEPPDAVYAAHPGLCKAP